MLACLDSLHRSSQAGARPVLVGILATHTIRGRTTVLCTFVTIEQVVLVPSLEKLLSRLARVDIE